MYHWHDFIGNIGVAFIVGTYLLLVLNRIDSTRLLYAGLNAAGAGMILISLIFEFNLSAFVVEFFWLLISVVGVIRILNQKMSREHQEGDYNGLCVNTEE